MQNQIVQNTSTHFIYPRAKKSTTQSIHFKLPTKKEIFDEIQFCRQLAIKTATKLGLIANKKKYQSDYPCQIKSTVEVKLQQTKSKPEASSDNTRALSYKLKFADLKNIQLKNYANVSSDAIDTTSMYVEVVCDDGKRIVVKKTSLCWLLGPDCRKMSSDRLLRVRYTNPISKSKSKQKIKLHKHFVRSILKSCNPTKRKHKPKN